MRRPKKHGDGPTREPAEVIGRFRVLLMRVLAQIDALRDAPGAASLPRPPDLEHLTTCERQLIKLASDEHGWPYKYIADRMGIALSTLHVHRRKVFSKLGVSSRAALVRVAVMWGLA